ncbi:MAG: hypothetical protein ABIJ81_01245 [Patescibacteria group bacterium]
MVSERPPIDNIDKKDDFDFSDDFKDVADELRADAQSKIEMLEITAEIKKQAQEIIHRFKDKTIPLLISSEVDAVLKAYGFNEEEIKSRSVEDLFLDLQKKVEHEKPIPESIKDLSEEEISIGDKTKITITPEAISEEVESGMLEERAREIINSYDSGGIPLSVNKRMEEVLLSFDFSEDEIYKKQPKELIEALRERLNLFENKELLPVLQQLERKEKIEESEDEKKKKFDFETVFNIKQEELESMAGWSELSEGQKALVFENMQQLTLARIQEDAIDNYKQKTTATNWLGRAWRGAFKKYFVAKEQKATAAEIQKGGLDTHGGVLTKLIDGIHNSGVEAVVKENSEVEIIYGGEADDYIKETPAGKVELNDEDKAKLAHFNEVASKFSKMPYEWQVGDSTDKVKVKRWSTTEKKHRAEFNKLQKDYKQSIQDINKLKEESLGDELKAAVAVKEIDYNVRMNQFMNTNPDVEKRLQEINSNEIWARALNSTIVERGFYMGFGGTMRLATTAVLGYTVAPLVAAVAAGHLAYRRAKEAIFETEQRARRGIKLESGEVSQLKQEIKQVKDNYKVSLEQLNQKLFELGVSDIDKIEGEVPSDIIDLNQKINSNIKEVSRLETLAHEARLESGEKPIVDVAMLSDKIFRLTQQIETETDEVKQAKLRGSLEARLTYTQDKLDKGLVNFGKGQQRLSEQYALLYLLSKAEATLASGKAEQIKDSDGKTLEQRIDRVLELNKQSVSKQEKKRIIKQVLVGGVIGAGFAGLGSYLFGLLRGGSAAVQEVKQPVGFEHSESIPSPTEIEVEIKGKINTFTEALDKAVHQAPLSTQDNFINKVFGTSLEITDANRDEILTKAVNKLSVDNLQGVGKMDVENLVYEGNKLNLQADGSWDMVKGSSTYEPKIVTEQFLRDEAAKIKSASIESPVHESAGAEWQKAEFSQWPGQEINWREALPNELPPDANLSDISMRVVDINGDGQADTYFLYEIDDHQIIDQVVLEPGETSAQLIEQAQTMYQQAGQEAKALDQIIGETGKSWDTGDRIIFSRGLGAEFKNGAFDESSTAILKQAVDKLGQQAPEFMRDHNLGEYIKGHLEQITCEQIEKMHEQGVTLHQAGWKEVDYNYIAEMAKHNRVTDGIKLQTKLLSPVTNKNLAVEFINKNKFDAETVTHTYELAKNAQTELADYVKSLKTRFEIIPAAQEHSLVDRLMSLDTKTALASFKGSYGGEQQVMIDKLYQELDTTLGHKLSQGTLSGTIGENLDKLALSKANAQALIEKAELLEKQFQAEELIGKAEQMLNNKSAAVPLTETGTDVNKASVPEFIDKTGKSSPEVVKEVQQEMKISQQAHSRGLEGIKDRAGDIFNESDNVSRVYDMLHNPTASVADKLTALKTLDLTDGGRPYMFKGGTEGIGLKEGKYFYYQLGSVYELTPENIDKIAGLK